MPSKRSRSKDRERKRKARQDLTEEEAERERQKTKARVKEIRGKQSTAQKELAKNEAKIRMRNFRKIHQSEKKVKKELGEEEIEFKKILDKKMKRYSRSQRTKEDIKNENLKSREGMKDFREFGRLKNFEKRSKKNKSELSDWKEYFEKGEKYSSFLQGKKPDLIEILNQEIREEKEREREKREQERKKKEEKDKKRKEGEWEYNGETGEWYWTGEKEPVIEEDFCTFKPLSEEEKKKSEETEKLHFEWWKEIRTRERNERRREKYRQLKEKMNTPIDPIPRAELCPYEKLRESNIKEREEAMRKSGYFQD